MASACVPLRALATLLAFAAGLLPAAAGAQQARPGALVVQQGITWDFETGNLSGWTPTGTAFRFQPTEGDNAFARVGVRSNHQGNFWIGTFERHPRGSQDPLGTAQGDGPQGTLTSNAFPIPGGTLSFLVGGGSSFETRVELLVIDQIEGEIRVQYASGQNSEAMRQVQWSLAEYQGRTGRIRIVDQSSAGWGHINVDDFVFGAPQPPLPDLTGLTVPQATARLAPLDLTLVRGKDVPSTSPAGTILGQTPAPGTVVPPGGSVRVDVSVWATVPRVTGMDTVQARQALARVGLQLGSRQSRPSSEPPGIIVDQSIPPGSEQPPRTVVDVVLAAPVPTPDLVGRDSATARRILAEQQLRLGSLEVRDADADPGTVVDQKPGARTLVPLGTIVDVAVASGARVPDLLGMDSVTATDLLQRSRLTLGRVLHERSPAPVGSLIRQNLQPGDVVRPGSPVAVVVADGVPVPSLMGLRIGPARDSLQGRQLTLGPIDERPSAQPIGTVVSQSPGPGTVIPLRGGVTVVLARGTPVPSVVGSSTPAARQALEGAEFAVGALTQEESTQAPGTVLRQEPAPGTLVPLQTPVDLVVAQGVPVPDLAGQDSVSARGTLERARLALGGVELRPSADTVGTVIAQTPAEGDIVALATSVDVVVAQGVPVPNVFERDTVLADSLVSSAGLRLVQSRRKWSLKPTGVVLEQVPDPGGEVPLQTPVTVVVARHIPVGWLSSGLLVLLAAPVVVGRMRTGEGGEKKKKKKKKKNNRKPEPGTKPRIELRPRQDEGHQEFGSGKPPRIAMELRWRAVGDPGRSKVESSGELIYGERKRPRAPTGNQERENG